MVELKSDMRPDLKELVEANCKIDDIYTLIGKLEKALDELKDIGPRTVLAVAATHYKALIDLEAKIEESRLKAYHLKNFYQMRVLPELFLDASTDRTTTLNDYTVTLKQDLSASIPKDSRDAAYQWLVENGLEDIITTTVNSSTLKATMKELAEKNMPFPPEDLIKITPLPAYSIRKAAKSAPKIAG